MPAYPGGARKDDPSPVGEALPKNLAGGCEPGPRTSNLHRSLATLADPMADGKRPSLAVEERSERGSREARRLRRAGFVPGVLYGASHPDPVSLKVGRT